MKVLRPVGLDETPAPAGFSRCDARNAALGAMLKAEGFEMPADIGLQANAVSKIVAHD